MDLQTEQEVWRRVKGPGPVTAPEALLPEKLEALILEQRTDAAALRDLSRRLRGQGSAVLNREAGRTEARVRELTTLHYLLTGRQLRLRTPPPVPGGPLPEGLRTLCLRLRQTTRACESLGEEFSDYAREFEGFAADARTQVRVLTQVLQSQLRTNR